MYAWPGNFLVSAIILLFEPDRAEITRMIDIRPVHVLMGEAIAEKMQ